MKILYQSSDYKNAEIKNVLNKGSWITRRCSVIQTTDKNNQKVYRIAKFNPLEMVLNAITFNGYRKYKCSKIGHLCTKEILKNSKPSYDLASGVKSKPVSESSWTNLSDPVVLQANQTKIIITRADEVPTVDRPFTQYPSILHRDVDAIVNAANESLMGGGGIDGAIHKAANEGLTQTGKFTPLQEEIRKAKAADPVIGDEKGTCPVGHGIITKSLQITSTKHIIYVVGPKGEDKESLQTAYETALRLARKSKDDAGNSDVKSIAFCCVSSEIFGYNVKDSAPVVLEALIKDCEAHSELKEIHLCMFQPKEKIAYEKAVQDKFQQYVVV